MHIDIRACAPHELLSLVRTLDLAFSWDLPDALARRFASLLEADRSFAAFERDGMVGSSSVFSFEVSTPGGAARCGGVTAVGVLPTHRRRGILRRMMREMLDQAHDRGEPLAALWASEDVIYQRFGFGLASRRMQIHADPSRVRFRDEAAGRVRLIDKEQAQKTFPEIYDRVRAVYPGMMSRSSRWWADHTLADYEQRRSEAGPTYYALWEYEGRAQGYALYRQKEAWDDDGLPDGKVAVAELMGTGPDAYREIWRYIFSIDLVTDVSCWTMPLHDPLVFMIDSPRALKTKILDGLWLRIVDIGGAVEARSYAADGMVRLALSDPFCQWNEGTWMVESAGGRGRAERTNDAPDISLSSADLAAIYLGGHGFADLMRAGRAVELRVGAAARAEAMFHTGAEPWCPEIF